MTHKKNCGSAAAPDYPYVITIDQPFHHYHYRMHQEDLAKQFGRFYKETHGDGKTVCLLGRSDAWISKHLGMDKDEVLRLKQITGLASLFRDVKFGQAWKPMEALPEENP